MALALNRCPCINNVALAVCDSQLCAVDLSCCSSIGLGYIEIADKFIYHFNSSLVAVKICNLAVLIDLELYGLCISIAVRRIFLGQSISLTDVELAAVDLVALVLNGSPCINDIAIAVCDSQLSAVDLLVAGSIGLGYCEIVGCGLFLFTFRSFGCIRMRSVGVIGIIMYLLRNSNIICNNVTLTAPYDQISIRCDNMS